MKKNALLMLISLLALTVHVADTQAATKTLTLSPQSNGRQTSESSATFQLTIPEDLVAIQRVVLSAIGQQRGKHTILLDTHVSNPDSKPNIELESLTFRSRKENRTLRLDISDATMHESSWVPGQTMLAFKVESEPESISQFAEIRIRYTTTQDEVIDPTLEEALIVGPATEMAPRQLDGLLPVDLDEFEVQDVPVPSSGTTKSQIKSTLNSGRPAGARPNIVTSEENTRFQTRSLRPGNSVKAPASDQDSDQPLATE